MIAYGIVWIVLVQVICSLRFVPREQSRHTVQAFFEKMDRPVDVKKEMGADYDLRSADLSAFKILGVVMVIISVLMGSFFLTEMSGREVTITLIALGSNLVLGLGMLYLGTRKQT